MDTFHASTIDPSSKGKMNDTQNFTIFQKEPHYFSEPWFLDGFERH